MIPRISVRNLSKSFHTTDAHGGGVLLHEMIDGLFSKKREHSEMLHALKDISFDVMPGEIIGLCGHNGAGKSTLLKIIAQVLYPTAGSVTINGKCFALLELGAGLHGEMTASENINLLASLMGLPGAWAKKYESEIISYAGLQQYQHMPVKYYSSGMKLRLAFSTVTLMPTDIVLFDESFAVGDIEFKEKVHTRLQEFFGKASAAVIVSHDYEFLKRYATRIIELAHGTIIRNEINYRV